MLTMPPAIHDNAPHSADAGSPPTAEEEFDAVLSEVLEEREAPAEAAANRAPPDTPLTDAGYTPAPAQHSAAESAPVAADAPAGDPQDNDIWVSADPKLKQAYDALARDAEHRINSFKGRLSAYDRELNRLRALAKQQDQQPDAPSKESGTPGTPGATDRKDSVARFGEDFPDIAEPVLSITEPLVAEIQELKQAIGGYTAQQKAAAEARELEILATKHPDWQSAVVDDRFEGWLGTQSQAIQDAFNRNANGWVDGRDAALVVGLFKAEVGMSGSPAPQRQQTSQPGNQGQDDRRQRQLANGRDASLSSPSASANGPDPEDIDGLIDFYSKLSDRRAGLNSR